MGAHFLSGPSLHDPSVGLGKAPKTDTAIAAAAEAGADFESNWHGEAAE